MSENLDLDTPRRCPVCRGSVRTAHRWLNEPDPGATDADGAVYALGPCGHLATGAELHDSAVSDFLDPPSTPRGLSLAAINATEPAMTIRARTQLIGALACVAGLAIVVLAYAYARDRTGLIVLSLIAGALCIIGGVHAAQGSRVDHVLDLRADGLIGEDEAARLITAMGRIPE